MQGKRTASSQPTRRAHIEYEKMQEEAPIDSSYYREKRYIIRGTYLT